MLRKELTRQVRVLGGDAHLAVMGRAERGRDVIKVRHGAYIDPGLRHRDHDVRLAEAELLDQHDTGFRIRIHLADLVLAGDAELHRTKAKLRGDVGGREVGDLDAGHPGDRTAVFARAARLDEVQAGAREEGFRILLQAALRRDGENEWRAHGSAPISFRRSIHTEKPTAGIGVVAPRRESNSS